MSPNTSVIVRPTSEKDLPGILTIIDREIREGVSHFGTEPMSEPALKGDWVRTCERFGWLSAIDNGEVIGYACAEPWKSRGAYRWTAEVGVYVRPMSQRRGIGRALYEALFTLLRERGIRTLIAGISLPNDASVKLHEAMGMTRVGVFTSIGHKHGAWIDTGYWQLHWGGGEPPE